MVQKFGPGLGASPRLPQNLLGQVGLGSFASVGRDRSDNFAGSSSVKYYLSLEIGEACQLKCRHCIYSDDPAHQKKPDPEVLEIVAAALQEGFEPFWISFAGKEPTLFPRELVDAVAQAGRRGQQRILMTNALRLDENLLDSLSPGITCFDVSLDGDRDAHDWMRGAGNFAKTWCALGRLSKRDALTGVIATATGGKLPDGSFQYSSIPNLARRLRENFGDEGKISLSVSLYYGPPSDPLRLTPKQVAEVVREVSETGFPSRILYTANYSHAWPEVSRRLGLLDAPVEYDAETDLPLVRLGATDIILFHMTPSPQVALRVSNRGYVYVGCNHLTIGKRAEEFKIGDVRREPLADIVNCFVNVDHPVAEYISTIPECCANCEDWDLCRGGDRLSGVYFSGVAVDPYCKKVY